MHYLTTNEPPDVIVLLCYSFNCMRVSIQLLAAIQINQLIDWLIDRLIDRLIDWFSRQRDHLKADILSRSPNAANKTGNGQTKSVLSDVWSRESPVVISRTKPLDVSRHEPTDS